MVNKLRLLLALFTCCFCLFAVAAEDLKGKRVLVLNAYDPLFPTYERRMQGILSVFSHNHATVDVEYMDSKRHFDNESQQLFLELLQQKIQSRPAYDAVITSDDNALTLALKYRKRLFPDAPIVFTGLNNEQLAHELMSRPGITGVVETVSALGSLELIGAIDPDRKYLHVVVDSTPSGRADLQRVIKAFDNISFLELNIIDLSELSWSEYTERVQQLSAQDAILLLSAFRDRNGKSVLFQETLDILNTNSQVPIYHLWEHGLGQGILGGLLINQFEQGREAALMVEQILTGTAVDDIPILLESTLQPMFDYQQLTRHDIALNDLPDAAQIFFKPPSVWAQYRLEISAIIFIMFVLSTAAIYLARETLLRTRLAREASQQNNFLRSLMNTLPDLIWLKDPKGYFMACNRQFELLYDAREADIIGKTDFDFVDQEQAQAFRLNDQHVMESDRACRNEETVIFQSDGHKAKLETIKTPLKQEDGGLMGVLGVSRDITERVAAEEQIRKLMEAVEQSPVSVMICDPAGQIEYVNHRFEILSGFQQSEVLGEKPRFLQREMMDEDNYEAVLNAMENNEIWEGEFKNTRKSGEEFYEYIHVSPILTDEDIVSGFLVVREDITLRRQQEEKIRFQAQYDSLTGLPNRVLSQDRLQVMIAQSHRDNTRVGVFYIDLDDFKKVNDTLGHDTGDKLLVLVAGLLSHCVREGDTVGRLGGDEFIILVNDMHDLEAGGSIASHIINELEKPIELDGRELLISASIGVACYPDDADKVNDLMRKADLAMYSAKRTSGSSYDFYTAELNDVLERRFLVEQQLRNALSGQEFYLVYQPKIDLSSGKTTGFEALLRWENDMLGNVSPGEFIPIAEQTGAIVNIGYFIIEKAFELLHSFSLQGLNHLTMAINLSPRQFRDDNLSMNLLSLVKKYDIKPEQLEFEMTEGLLIDELPRVKEKLEQLHQAGIGLAMDDFGTGYSSLSYLRRYPFDTLKIDQEFVQGIADNTGDRELVNAAISMAHGLGLSVVAEGVETEEQMHLLQKLGCDTGQGYLFSRPMVTEQLTDFVKNIENTLFK